MGLPQGSHDVDIVEEKLQGYLNNESAFPLIPKISSCSSIHGKEHILHAEEKIASPTCTTRKMYLPTSQL